MKNNTAIIEALEKDHAIKAVPQMIIDWNMNRYIGAVASNNPSESLEGYDIEIFPIESIVANNRPTKGINKARVNSGTVGNDYRGGTFTQRNGRYYVADVDDTYKYWTSPYPSDTNGNITKVKPQIVYDAPASVNKIVINTENSWATAAVFSVQVTTSANPSDTVNSTNWVEVANQTTLGNSWKASGQIELYYNGTGQLNAWTTNGRADDGTKRVSIRGIRIVVTSLQGGYKSTSNNSLVPSTYQQANASGLSAERATDGKESFFDLIEISARWECDLSEYVISVDDNFDFSETSALYPIGTVTSNQASIELSNLYQPNGSNDWKPGAFSANNSESSFAPFIEANAEVTLSYRYFDEDDNFLGTVQQFKMYVDEWAGQSEDSVSLDLTDYSKFFDTNEAKMPACMWEGLSVPEIIWRVMDSIGFVDYVVVSDEDRVTEHIIPVFFTDGEETVWEVLDGLAKASQTAIYFDGFGKLQIKTRDFAFSTADAPVWNLTAESNSARLANIVELNINTEFEPNYFKVMYQKTNWSPDNAGMPSMQQVWEPEADVLTLRATPAIRTIEANNMAFWMTPAEIRYWPYEGIVNIEGELMRFKGKQFIYYTGANGNTRNSMIVDSNDDYNARNNKTPIAHRHKNHFTGAMIVTERGLWNSEVKRHSVDAEGYSVHQVVNGNFTNNVTGFRHDKTRSRVQLITGFNKEQDYRLATRGNAGDTPFYNYGMRFRFLKDVSKVHQRAGMVIHNSGNQENGYYISFTPSSKLGGKERAKYQELVFYGRVAGKNYVLAQSAVAIAENIDYEVDVSFNTDGSGNHVVGIWVNGKNVINKTIGGSERIAANGRFGIFAQGSSRIECEYLYALAREEESKMLEDFSFLDKAETGYTGNQWDREWVFKWRSSKRRIKRPSGKERRRFNRAFFDEFGPIIHEVREFDVQFDPKPVLHSRLYMTNDWSGCCIEYRANPFGASFILANTSRKNAVLHGEDTISFTGTGGGINQVLTVFGRPLIIEEAEEVVAENSDQIRRRGKNESEITSPWIQSKQMARDLAAWMRNHFSYGNDNITVEIFGNTLIELGDVVNVNYPDKYVSGDYFVIGTSTEMSDGLSTTLQLRRRA